MYALYQKQLQGSDNRYVFREQVSLFGCNSGYIPKLLKHSLDTVASEPCPWHLNVGDSMEAAGESGKTLIINLKPKNAKPNLSLYEVVDVWGYSNYGWTPIMFYLRGLLIDADPIAFDDKDFARTPEEVTDPIFSMMYLSGTILNGSIVGRWTPPGPSPTNSVLLWPKTFKYFAEEARAIMERTE
jgi:hypothetical protein